METKVNVGVSARHLHVTKEIYECLFDEPITMKAPLHQIGQFASNSLVTLKNGDYEIPNVRIIGPFRKYNQVEISKTDAFKLHLNPKVRASGDVSGTDAITLIGPKGEVTINEGLIIADRHVHFNTKDISKYGVVDKQPLLIRINGEKKGTIEAFAKISDDGFFELHIDTDDANAFLLKSEDKVDLII